MSATDSHCQRDKIAKVQGPEEFVFQWRFGVRFFHLWLGARPIPLASALVPQQKFHEMQRLGVVHLQTEAGSLTPWFPAWVRLFCNEKRKLISGFWTVYSLYVEIPRCLDCRLNIPTASFNADSHIWHWSFRDSGKVTSIQALADSTDQPGCFCNALVHCKFYAANTGRETLIKNQAHLTITGHKAKNVTHLSCHPRLQSYKKKQNNNQEKRTVLYCNCNVAFYFKTSQVLLCTLYVTNL